MPAEPAFVASLIDVLTGKQCPRSRRSVASLVEVLAEDATGRNAR
ncbi:hypothetical protein [Actinoplanes sp. DH11]|nr:hypothetical protein [Actinoplanes sp. DH11]